MGRPAPFALNALGVAYRNLGEFEAAFGAFQTATQVAPASAKTWSNLGVVALELGRIQQADDAFYYAAEALGPDAALDETLLQNIKVLQNRALGLPQGADAALELFYEEEAQDD